MDDQPGRSGRLTPGASQPPFKKVKAEHTDDATRVETLRRGIDQNHSHVADALSNESDPVQEANAELDGLSGNGEGERAHRLIYFSYATPDALGDDRAPPREVYSADPYKLIISAHQKDYDPHIQKDAAWSPDGTCILTSSGDHRIRVYQLWYREHEKAYSLIDTATFQLPEPIVSFITTPNFHWSSPTSQDVLFSCAQGIHVGMVNCSKPSKIKARYPLLKPGDDCIGEMVHCMKFLPDGSQFICGTANKLAIFDVSRYNAPPVAEYFTGTKWQQKHDSYRSFRGIVSAIDYRAEDGMLAVGSYNRKLAFYGDYGKGDIVAIKDMRELMPNKHQSCGKGINWVRWSPDGWYLYLAERDSDFIHAMDFRMPDRPLITMTGRRAYRPCRLGIDLLFNENGHHIIAGGADGFVRVWNNPFIRDAENSEPDIEWKAHDEHVSSVAANPWYTKVVVTTSGEWIRRFDSDHLSSSSSSSSSEDSEEGDLVEDSEDSESESESKGVGKGEFEVQGRFRGPSPGWKKLWEFK